MMTAASWRSVLCVPGHDARKVSKCRSYGADLVLFDLEDGVPDDRKPDALRLVTASLTPADAVRVCHPSHPLFEAQCAALDTARCGILWVPKVEEGGDVRAAFGPWSIVALIETPRGVRNLDVIADLGPAALAFGRFDFMAATSVTDIWSPLVNHAMAEIAMVSKANGIEANDAPCYDLHDKATLRREIERAKGYGFTGKGCVHPDQVVMCQELFSPTYDEISRADRVLSTDSVGVTQVDGILVGPPMRKLAQSVVDRCRA